ncbi:hypothetical protein HMPREF9372_0044 [Sporosarcina newyorkensis 2681]|uniref:Uncharacterized protein n=1 Tax=Sporosarcina newyorkensis 2681 TaxID=1027292 RepID=F9DML4_9BACL|nr:hypothetical protein HMPREF9372_0044 [Sporosarcina newyorkensis 2681]
MENNFQYAGSIVGMIIFLSVFIFGLSIAALIIAVSYGYNS